MDLNKEPLKDNETDWLTPAQYALEIGAPYETVRSWIHRGLLIGAEQTVDLPGPPRYRIRRGTPRPQLKRGPKPKATEFNPVKAKAIIKELENSMTDAQWESVQYQQAEHYLVKAIEAESHLNTLDENQWLHWFEQEDEQLTTALQYYSTRDPEKELRLALILIRHLEMHGRYMEGLNMMKSAVERQPSRHTAMVAHGLARLGLVTYRMGDYAEAHQYLTESLVISKDLDAKPELTLGLNVLGRVLLAQGLVDDARLTFQDALAYAYGQVPKQAAWAYRGLGLVAQQKGQLAQAMTFHEKSLEGQHKIGNLREIAAQYDSLGEVAASSGHYDAARRYFEKSLIHREGAGNRNGMASCYFNLGELESLAGNGEQARTYFEKSLQLAEAIGSKSKIGKAQRALAKLTAGT